MTARQSLLCPGLTGPSPGLEPDMGASPGRAPLGARAPRRAPCGAQSEFPWNSDWVADNGSSLLFRGVPYFLGGDPPG